jgi:hypothetical protein
MLGWSDRLATPHRRALQHARLQRRRALSSAAPCFPSRHPQTAGLCCSRRAQWLHNKRHTTEAHPRPTTGGATQLPVGTKGNESGTDGTRASSKPSISLVQVLDAESTCEGSSTLAEARLHAAGCQSTLFDNHQHQPRRRSQTERRPESSLTDRHSARARRDRSTDRQTNSPRDARPPRAMRGSEPRDARKRRSGSAFRHRRHHIMGLQEGSQPRHYR